MKRTSTNAWGPRWCLDRRSRIHAPPWQTVLPHWYHLQGPTNHPSTLPSLCRPSLKTSPVPYPLHPLTAVAAATAQMCARPPSPSRYHLSPIHQPCIHFNHPQSMRPPRHRPNHCTRRRLLPSRPPLPLCCQPTICCHPPTAPDPVVHNLMAPLHHLARHPPFRGAAPQPARMYTSLQQRPCTAMSRSRPSTHPAPQAQPAPQRQCSGCVTCRRQCRPSTRRIWIT
mmetsp:Transcript_121037/g.210520  ORF Transcript_121037/g.210520 Transcript_121037/m.210520 type:complete len:226 (-) Transcript_121037:3076-3753(-)